MSDEIGRRNAAWAEFKDNVGCSLRDAARIAEEHDDCKMTLLNKGGGVIEATWLDPSLELFQTKDDPNHFITVDQVRKLGVELWVLSMVDGSGKNVPLRDTSENTRG